MSRNSIYEEVARYLIEGFSSQKLKNEVDARELYYLLMIREPFSLWIKRRIKQCGLQKNRDYLFMPGRGVLNHKYPKILNYYLTNSSILKIVSKEQTLIGQRIREYLETLSADNKEG